MNMRKIIAVLAAALMLCAAIPMAALSVSAAPGDVIISKNFDDGSYFSNGSNENGYMVFNATTADWANVYLYANAIKNATKYEITFDCKANKATNINVKINNNWAGDTFKWTTNVTTEWETYSCVITSNELKELTSTALLMFTSNTTAANGAIYHIDNVVVKEYTDPATIGSVTNGDFETGNKNGWSGSASVISGGYNSNYAAQLNNPGQWSEALVQTVSVEANTDYEITWMSKRVSGSGAFNLIVCQSVSPWTNFTKVAGQNWMNETSGNWVANTFTINTGDNTSMLLKFTTEATNPGEILLDNIVVSKVKEASDDGFIKNGDFETGKALPWTVYSGTAVSADAAKSGDYGLYVKNPTGGWGGTAYQNFTTEVGKTYVVMMDAKAISNGQNIQIKDNGTTKASKWFTGTSWTTLSFEYTATSTAGTINICGGGTGGNEEVYFDNIFVFEKKAASNDGYIVNGDFETGTTEGFAPSSQTAISRDAAKDGNFGAYLKNSAGNWGGVGLWTITGLEVGATYKFQMDMKAVNKGLNWTLWQDSTSSGVKYANGYFSTAAWTTIEKEFVAGSTTAVLNINGGNTGVSEEVYLDNLKITLVKPAHTCEFVGVETKAPTCGETGVMTYTCACGDSYTEEIAATGEHVYFDDCSAICDACGYEREVSHNVIHVEAVAPTCTALGNIEYWYCDVCGQAWLDAECTMNTNMMAVKLPMAEHEYFNDCDVVCMNCYQETREASHNVNHAVAVAPTCEALGNIEYWYCDACGAAWLDAECTMNTNMMAVKLPMAEHEYFNDCDTVCMNCYQETREASHNVIHVEAVAPTCNALGNIEYWSCDVCGMAWLDEACTLNTNRFAVILPMAEEHTYDNEFDVDCNVCGAVRDVVAPLSNAEKSISEDVNGYAVKFDCAAEGFGILPGTFVQADYTNATYKGYKLVKLGVIASNGSSETNIEGLRMYDLADGVAKFAFRIINIPADKLDVTITMTPYYVVEIDGVETTLYGEDVIGSYAEIAG